MTKTEQEVLFKWAKTNEGLHSLCHESTFDSIMLAFLYQNFPPPPNSTPPNGPLGVASSGGTKDHDLHMASHMPGHPVRLR